MGSADWMPRNLDRRVEILFPVEDEILQKSAYHILEVELKDNVKAHILRADGEYEKVDKRGKALINSQDQFCKEVKIKKTKEKGAYQDRVFIPAEPM